MLAIIPARGGSKGVKRKNIKKINGQSLISYTIREAMKSKYITKLIVSTEDEEIAQEGKRCGAEVPFLRPIELAKDDTPGIDPIIHAIRWLEEKGEFYDYVMCIQCTSPFRKSWQIDEAIEKLIKQNVDSIVSVCESEVTPYWMKIIENGKMRSFFRNENNIVRRQDAPIVYRLNGAIYICKTDILLKYENWYTEKTIAYIMDKVSSIDIDDMIDFKFAEFIMKENENDWS